VTRHTLDLDHMNCDVSEPKKPSASVHRFISFIPFSLHGMIGGDL